MVDFNDVNEADIESYLSYSRNDYLFFYGHRVSCPKPKRLETKGVLEDFISKYGHDEYITFIDDIRNSKVGYLKLNELSINSIRYLWRYYNSFIFFIQNTDDDWNSFRSMIKESEIHQKSEVQLQLMEVLKLEKVYVKIDDTLVIYSDDER